MPSLPLRPYQETAVEAVCRFIKYRKDNGYLKAAGAGKSVLIAAVAEYAYSELNKRIIVLARSERLLTQNRAKFHEKYQPYIGTYCATLGEKTLDKPITIASIQSICSQGGNIKADLIICDEAHNIHPDSDSETQYWSFFNALGNPQIIGFTATDWRTASGKLSFGRKIYDIPFAKLVEEKFLIPPTNKVVANPDLSKVQIVRGEYNGRQLDDIYLEPELLAKSIAILQKYTADRHSVLIFTQSREHGRVLQEAMADNGMTAFFIDGTMDKKKEINPLFGAFERLEYKYLINVALAIEGVDLPVIDCVAVFTSTASKGRWEQMLYRGTRICPALNKKDFLVLDLGGNFQAHGTLGSPYIEKPKGKEQKKSQGKICPECESFTPPASKHCPDCGYVFTEPEKNKLSHDDEPDLSGYADTLVNPIVKYEVTAINYAIHRKVKNGIESFSIKIDFYCPEAEKGKISKWISPHNENDWARNQAVLFFKNGGNPLVSDIRSYSLEDLIWKAGSLKTPSHITVDISEKFPDVKIIHYDEPQESKPIEIEQIWEF